MIDEDDVFCRDTLSTYEVMFFYRVRAHGRTLELRVLS